MDNNKQIETIENKIEELKQEVEKLKNKKGNSKASSWERVGYNRRYYFSTSGRTVSIAYDYKDNYDYSRYDSANYNTDYDYLRKITFEENLRRRMLRWADENNEGEIDWGDPNQKKYCIYYSFSVNKLVINYNLWHRCLHEIYFTSEKIAQEALEVFREDLEKLYKKN